MRVLHISDLHVDVPLGAVPWRDWIGKRALAGLVYALRRRRHFRTVPEKLVALARFAAEHEVDLVLCTGDHTALGTEPELERARSELEAFMQRPLGFVHVPGNHDLYLPSALRERRFERHFDGTLATDLPDLAIDGTWPLVRLFGEGVAVVAVNSARPNPQLWRSSGEIPADQLEALGRALGDPRLRDRFVFVMTHYAPRLPNGRPDGVLHGLENADDFLAICRRVARGAILHGHLHSCFRLDLPDLPAIFCAGSTTHRGREGFWLFDVSEQGVPAATAVRGRFEGARYRLDGTPVPV